jgi:endoglucanase
MAALAKTLLALSALLGSLLALASAGPAFAQQPGVPTLPDTSKLTVRHALRQCGDPPPQPQRPPTDPRGVAPGSPNPLAGLTFFVDPTEPAWLKWRSFRRRGKNYSAAMMWKVASQPRFRWMGRWTRPRMATKIREFLNCVKVLQPGAVPLITVMRHQGKKCSKNYTAGGRREDARTRKWYRKFASAIGNERVVIAFEPDSLGTIDCLKRSRRRARMKMLAYGVKVMSRIPNATVYLEAGASDWESARRTAWQLRSIGIRRVRGFMLNVTHYDWTANNIRHGRRISRLTGGKHFIISTAFNGRGPVHVRSWISRSRNIWRRINVWCHPLKRGLGPVPTTRTHDPKVDGYMWIGRPGYSGGSCNGGPLPVGRFWPERAIMFGEYATNWLRPPAGTRNGHYRSYSAKQLGYDG